LKHTILVVDDDPVQRRLLEAAVLKAGYNTIKASDGNEALAHLSSNECQISAVILDLIMPGMDGMAVMQHINQLTAPPPVIVQTAQGGIETVVNAMREGAFDFVVKPVAPDRLTSALERALKFQKIASTPEKQRPKTKNAFTFDDIVTKSATMAPIIAMGRKASASNIPVLIEGESGVGKELVAKAIHGTSARAGKPMVTVNCGALPENLIESLLFGHEKGAFTGASDKHIGKFEEANGGTLFLDEIGELPLDLQVKMLRAIQEGEIDPVGAKKSVKIDVRFVSATNRRLLDEVKAGRFREDLYYRLNVLPMTLPPLRERHDDIEPLIYHFVKKIAREENRKNISAIQPLVLQTLIAYDWPGNIRELENAIFRAMILCEGEELSIDEFPQIVSQLPDFDLQATLPDQTASENIQSVAAPLLQTPDEPVPSRGSEFAMQPTLSETANATCDFGMVRLISAEDQVKTLEEIEGEAIRFAIEIYNGRMSEIARRLAIGRSTLYRKMKEHQIDTDQNEAEPENACN
jgi:DNA-binding NtrC family response regulator